jgi:citrate lyase beta subunit
MDESKQELGPLAAAAGPLLERLAAARGAGDTPVARAGRQPVHVLYGGAHLFKADSARKLGGLARAALAEQAPDAESFGALFGAGPLSAEVRARVERKLQEEPIEDLRIDFEDGYGHRPAGEEDADAARCGRAVAEGMAAGSLPPLLGIRIKALGGASAARGVRTLGLFFEALCQASGGKVPPQFCVTLPKVSLPAEVEALAGLLSAVERQCGLRDRSLQLELMVETAAALVGPQGTLRLRQLVEAGQGRCAAAHFGAYDYLASLGLTGAAPSLAHPACDLARQLLQLSLAGTGVRLSDGATTVLPIARHRAPKGAPALTAQQEQENREAVAAASRLHFSNVRRALEAGLYQGWDLHPAQLVARYAAVYSFFLAGLAPSAARLKNFLGEAAQATRVGEVFDDAATGQGLLEFFARGLACGALTEAEALCAGLTRSELEGRSFEAIVRARR